MFTKIASLTSFFLLLVAVFVSSSPKVTDKPRVCNEEYCAEVVKTKPCPLVLCIPGNVPLRRPELCRCCTRCYTPVGKGQHCNATEYIVCENGLKCNTDNLCY